MKERAQLGGLGAAAEERAVPGDAGAVVLAAADGLGNTAIAAKLGIHITSARRWRSRFLALRLDGLLDEPRPGQPAGTVSDDQVEAVITATLESTPANATHWSTRSLAWPPSWACPSRRCRGSGGRSPCSRTGSDSWKLSRDPLFISKVRDVVGLYLNPPERAVVLCVDEKSQIQALWTAPPRCSR